MTTSLRGAVSASHAIFSAIATSLGRVAVTIRSARVPTLAAKASVEILVELDDRVAFASVATPVCRWSADTRSFDWFPSTDPAEPDCDRRCE